MSVDLDKNRKEITKAYDDLLNDKTSTDWLLLGYEAQTNVLKLVGTGDGGLEELADDLNSSKVMYAVVRLTDPMTTRTKLVLINWIGEATPNLRKGICARHLHDVRALLKGVHVTINARNEEEVETDQVFAALARATSTTYDFSDRAEYDDRNAPVRNLVVQFREGTVVSTMGTNYQRTNPLSEINTNSRNKFWEQQEQEESRRKEEEMKRKRQEEEKIEVERKKREVESSTTRDAATAQRSEHILAVRRASEAAEQRLVASSDGADGVGRDDGGADEEERARRAEQMRRERKKEAESVIGHSTKSARSLFESQHQQHHNNNNNVTTTNSSSSSSSSSSNSANGDVGRPPPRKLKEFNPVNCRQDVNGAATSVSSSASSSSSSSRAPVSRAWPPPSNSTGALVQEVRKVPHAMFSNSDSASSHQQQLTSSVETTLGGGAAPRRMDPIGGNARTFSRPERQEQQHQEQPASADVYEDDSRLQQSYRTQQQQDVMQQQQLKHNQQEEQFRQKRQEEELRKKEQEEQLRQKQQEEQFRKRQQEELLRQKQQEEEFRKKQQEEHLRLKQQEQLRQQQLQKRQQDEQLKLQQQKEQLKQQQRLHEEQVKQQQLQDRLKQEQQQQQQQLYNHQRLGGTAAGQSNGSDVPGAAAATGGGGGGVRSNSQSHLYDEVPEDYGDDDPDRIYDMPADVDSRYQHSSPPTSNGGPVSPLSPGPASPHIESTPSVAMTYEVDGIEYQLLPEHGLCARALYDYQASDDTEISFDPAEIISNIEQIDEGWWQGVGPSGDFGLFPANYVELINAATSPSAGGGA